MKTTLRLAVAALAALTFTSALAQGGSASRSAKSDALLRKVREIDLLNFLVPLVMTKDQVNKLLVVVEKCRANVEKTKDFEAKELAKFEARIDDTIKKGIEKDVTPAKPLMVELSKLFTALTVNRQVAANENADMVLEHVKKDFNAGQLKAMENAHDIKVFDPKVDVSKLTSDDKLKFFIKDVILDPFAYDLLLKISKATK